MITIKLLVNLSSYILGHNLSQIKQHHNFFLLLLKFLDIDHEDNLYKIAHLTFLFHNHALYLFIRIWKDIYMIMLSMLMGVYHYILNNLKESISILLLNIFMKNLLKEQLSLSTYFLFNFKLLQKVLNLLFTSSKITISHEAQNNASSQVYHYILNNLKESISILLLNIFMKNLESMMLVKFLFNKNIIFIFNFCKNLAIVYPHVLLL